MESTERRSPEQVRERNIATLRHYFDLLQRKRTENWIDLWAERCVARTPYAPGGLPRLLTGRADVHAFYRDQVAAYRRVTFGEVTMLPMDDPGRVAARWFPKGELLSGDDYANEHFAVFEFDAAGRITALTEYFDPAALTALAPPTSTGAV
ncbi:nuclear transport factor 2 family protein [Streptomyces marincola]|uniref:nuclear transport factor 2 family protein n=1 Tax=Streptomyces marincola TaxID=2878388 RepID=UPI001CF39E6A|nr:nuclear transport factor 2 family protein [Streptomyces marincola]UCM88154.1 nuclear transport factor 2 family protein [Streptomyces marincola]